MLRVATDENFDGRVLRALLNRLPGLDVVRIQDSEVSGAADMQVLTWAAREGRVLLTRDRRTMIQPVRERISAGKPVSGVILLRRAPIGRIIEDLKLAISVYENADLRDQVVYLPL